MSMAWVIVIALVAAIAIGLAVSYEEREQEQEIMAIKHDLNNQLQRVQSSLLEQQQVAQRLEDKLSNAYVYSSPYYAGYYPTRYYAPYRNWRRWW